MNYIFFGTPRFGALVLKKLISAGMPPLLVVCNPDKPVGRKQIVTAPPVKRITEIHDIPVYQPKTLKSEEVIQELSRHNIDTAVVAAYGKIIPDNLLRLPKHGMVNIHPSLLPKYRGATPIQSVILEGDSVTGVTIIVLDKELDHGPIIAQRTVTIDGRGYEELEQLLAEEGAELLVTTLPRYLSGDIQPKPQEHADATMTKKFTAEDAYVPYDDLRAAVTGDAAAASRIDRMVRAFTHEPGVWTEPADTTLNLPVGKRVKILETRLEEGLLHLVRIQVAGKKPQLY
ncbi:MAG TPA: methionyl-tRNA formyltransferase [Candidatus Jorgensenbacteria bacterium]|nr:methionyl-tRNA formyltransferase [Candidatus Jorgensenbacteria bacterium]